MRPDLSISVILEAFIERRKNNTVIRIPSRVDDMRRETRAFDFRIPHSIQRPTLKEKDEDLNEVRRSHESYEDPKEL